MGAGSSPTGVRIATIAIAAVFVVVQVGPAEASCPGGADFAPESSTRVPPNAISFVFLSGVHASDYVVRVHSDGQDVESSRRYVEVGNQLVLEVRVATDDVRSYSIEVAQRDNTKLTVFASARYFVSSETKAASAAAPIDAFERLLRIKLDGRPPSDGIYAWLPTPAHAYRVEWSRSEKAYRDGDRQTAILPPFAADENVVALGRPLCGRTLFDPRDDASIFLGIAPISFRGDYHVPTDPIELVIADVPSASAEQIEALYRPRAGTRKPAPGSRLVQVPPEKTTEIESKARSPTLRWLLLGVILGFGACLTLLRIKRGSNRPARHN